MKSSIKYLAYLLLVFSFSQLYAQTGVGKLTGRVLDASTKEPLIGANIVLLNTELGAATDIEGRFFVLNIVPGNYSVRFSYVGYGTKTFEDVRIVAGITNDLEVELSTEFTLSEVVVKAEKKFFEEKSTNTIKVLDADEINKLPVKGVEKVAGLQAGVVIADGSGGADGNATINVRGGRGNEVLYIIDGVPQNDILQGGNSAQVSTSSIDQVSFQIGGYEAKYGQAQSGIINVTTKSGSAKYTVFGDVVSSSFTDDYGYNLYTLNLGGPIIPGNSNHTFFLSGERGWFADADPSAISIVIPTANINSTTKPNNSSAVWRYTARTFHSFSPFTLRLGANINMRDSRAYTHTYAKSNAEHNPLTQTENWSFSGRFSHTLNDNSFWNLNVGYRLYDSEQGDGVWFDNLDAYGDTLANAPYVSLQGSRVNLDPIGLFFGKGRVSNSYTHTRNGTLTFDLDYTTQANKHLVEVGGGLQYHTLRYFALAPVAAAIDVRGANIKTLEERVALQQPYYFGFDIIGKNAADGDEYKQFGGLDYLVKAKPRHPVIGYAYIQDRFELSDLVLNVGIRWDYFDSQADILRDEEYPFSGGTNPNDFDDGDFVVKEAESFISPRIGLGFPVTDKTVFHAQFGKFIQQPNLIDVFTSRNSLSSLVKDDNFGLNTGNVNSEVTTQYEIGFRQVLGNNNAALNFTAFYKNTKGLVNDETRFFYRTLGGQRTRYYGPANSDFGTIKGVAVTLNVARMTYVALNIDYTYSVAEGTGSSTSSSTTAAFRNSNGETPKVIAPLDFDQRHTGVINLDFSIPAGHLGVLENMSLNLLYSFASGRPYTPLLQQNITPGGASNLGETKGYVNSAYGPGTSRMDLKLEKEISFGGVRLTPYLWVENVFDVDNATTVYRTTGSPYSTDFLNTSEGRGLALTGGQDYVDDYMALERDPGNFGIPRLIKLGVRVNFTGFTL